MLRCILKRNDRTCITAFKRYSSDNLSHVDKDGKARMVDVSAKEETVRTAEAVATVDVGEAAYKLIRKNALKKGDVLSVAQLAGIMAAKKTSELIPLCHPLPLSQVNVQVTTPDHLGPCVCIVCTAKTRGESSYFNTKVFL